eukprot:175959_1
MDTCMCGTHLLRTIASNFNHPIQCNQCRHFITNDIVYHCPNSIVSHQYLYDLCSTCYTLSVINPNINNYVLSPNAKYYLFKVFTLLTYLCGLIIVGIQLNHKYVLISSESSKFFKVVGLIIMFCFNRTAVYYVMSHDVKQNTRRIIKLILLTMAALYHGITLISLTSMIYTVNNYLFSLISRDADSFGIELDTKLILEQHTNFMIWFTTFSVIFMLMAILGMKKGNPLIYCLTVGICQWMITSIMIYMGYFPYSFWLNPFCIIIVTLSSFQPINQMVSNKILFEYDPDCKLDYFKHSVMFIQVSSKWWMVPLFFAMIKWK